MLLCLYITGDNNFDGYNVIITCYNGWKQNTSIIVDNKLL
jgi:hypothetical protein